MEIKKNREERNKEGKCRRKGEEGETKKGKEKGKQKVQFKKRKFPIKTSMISQQEQEASRKWHVFQDLKGKRYQPRIQGPAKISSGAGETA